MSEVANVKEGKKYVPVLEDIKLAFEVVFPKEKLQEVSYTREADREVFTIISDKRPRTYMRADPSQTFEDLLRTTPHLPEPKEEK
jgi:hypothetical protein